MCHRPGQPCRKPNVRRKRARWCVHVRRKQVHYVLDEIIMGGMVLETNINQILTAINDQNRLHSASNKVGLPSGPTPIAGSGRPRSGQGGVGGPGIPGMRTR